MINHILHRLSENSVLTGVLQLIEDTERGENIYTYNYVLISLLCEIKVGKSKVFQNV